VIDRQTGEKIGYVLLWGGGWSAYLDSNPGTELIFGHRRWPEKRRRAMGEGEFPVKFSRYRSDAAEKVWHTHNAPANATVRGTSNGRLTSPATTDRSTAAQGKTDQGPASTGTETDTKETDR
jgi:hypothetical protein